MTKRSLSQITFFQNKQNNLRRVCRRQGHRNKTEGIKQCYVSHLGEMIDIHNFPFVQCAFIFRCAFSSLALLRKPLYHLHWSHLLYVPHTKGHVTFCPLQSKVKAFDKDYFYIPFLFAATATSQRLFIYCSTDLHLVLILFLVQKADYEEIKKSGGGG